jgi:hypothetical protein
MGYLKNFHFSGDSNIQSGTPAARLSPNQTNWLSHCWPQAKPGWAEDSVLAMAGPLQGAAMQAVWE